ncbi:MAG: hypothetical protein HQK85_07720, partial [Nitrospinae bacterium]|nr:hypothetical protein [Nitrospinota bacterium]
MFQPQAPQNKESGFDPSVGRQDPSTGIAGALFMLALIATYALFKTHALKNGGPPLTDCLAFFPKGARFAVINREYFDIMGVVFAGFLFMVTWEFSLNRNERMSVLLMGLFGVTAAVVALGRGSRRTDPEVSRYLGWDWTGFEIALAFVCVGLCLLWALRLVTRGAPRPVQPAIRALKTGFARWSAGLLFFTLVIIIFTTHPFYKTGYYENWRITVSYLYLVYLLAGLPYAFVTN